MGKKDSERARGGKGRREHKAEVMPAEGEVVIELPSGAQPRRMMGTAAAGPAAADLVGCAGGASPRRGEGDEARAAMDRWKGGRAVCSFAPGLVFLCGLRRPVRSDLLLIIRSWA